MGPDWLDLELGDKLDHETRKAIFMLRDYACIRNGKLMKVKKESDDHSCNIEKHELDL